MFKRNQAWDSLPASKPDHSNVWDADARLIQPFGAEQALIYDYAECIAARTFLHMSNLPHTVEGRQNAEYISPTRELPVLLSHGLLVSGFESIVRFAMEQGFVSLEVTDQEMDEMEGLVSLVQEVLVNAELYICWVVKPVLRKQTGLSGSESRRKVFSSARDGKWRVQPREFLWFTESRKTLVTLAEWENPSMFMCIFRPFTSDVIAKTTLSETTLTENLLYVIFVIADRVLKVTIPRFSCFYSWPLNHILPWARMKVIRGNLGASDWLDKSLDQVLLEVKLCCRVLSLQLQEKPYLMGSRPTPLDALVFGHLYTLITTDLPSVNLGAIVKQFPNLEQLCRRIDETYFKEPTEIEDSPKI